MTVTEGGKVPGLITDPGELAGGGELSDLLFFASGTLLALGSRVFFALIDHPPR
jgi:hypothetical protein